MEIYCRIDYKKEMVKYIWSTGYVHLHAFIVFFDLEEDGIAVLDSMTHWQLLCEKEKGNRGLALPMVSVKSVFRVHLIMYQQLQQLGLPEARSWAAPCQGRRYGTLWQAVRLALSQYKSQSWTERRVGLFLYGLWPLWPYLRVGSFAKTMAKRWQKRDRGIPEGLRWNWICSELPPPPPA